VQAQQETAALLEKAQADAEAEAQRLVARGGAQQGADILAQAEEEARRMEARAVNGFTAAVSYVLDRVLGKK